MSRSRKPTQTQQPAYDFDVTLEGHPAMKAHPEPTDLASKIPNPHVPRANLATTANVPEGSTENGWAQGHKHMSVLEQHCSFFDRDGDGIIWPIDTLIAFWELGYAVFWCIFSMTVIHGAFSWWTLDSWVPDPFFRINLRNIHRAKHGSDTGTYDTEGRFVPSKYEEMFSKYDREGKGGLTWWDGMRMIRGNRMAVDPFGWFAAFFEFMATYLLVWPQDGIITKEAFRRVYDGSFFFEVAEKEKHRSQAPFSGFYKENKPGKTIK